MVTLRIPPPPVPVQAQVQVQVQASKIPEQLADSSSPPLRWEYYNGYFGLLQSFSGGEHDGFAQHVFTACVPK